MRKIKLLTASMVLAAMFMFSGHTIYANQQGSDNHYMKYTVLQVEDLNKEEKQFVDEVKTMKGIYKKDDLYVIALGPKPTAVYSLNFVKQKESWEQIILYFKETKPDPDAMNAEVITYPYIVAKMAKPKTVSLSFLDSETGNELIGQAVKELDVWEMRTEIAKDKKWVVKFNQELDPQTITTDNIFIKEYGTVETVPLTKAILSKDKKSVTLVPDENFKPDSRYQIIISPEIKGKNGLNMLKGVIVPFTVKCKK
ncbi:protease complex subunit PrcB family protein [Falsibacillus pallidus]|uniref:protease complex subunit PrcB family protein n=1 Tax=Falsibacillus pallidus TaxID=493781 RepID=UPI003D97040A